MSYKGNMLGKSYTERMESACLAVAGGLSFRQAALRYALNPPTVWRYYVRAGRPRTYDVTDSVLGKWTCRQCGREYDVFTSYNRHVKESVCSGNFSTCQVCGRTFTRKDSLKRHYQNAHSKEDE
ncbi:hypothetical protein CHUAL_012795 [Chamberlinius hualienensis]